LVVPRYMAKYFPGHALLLAPFVALGKPWLFSSAALAAAAALVFAVLRTAGAGKLASFAAGAIFLGSGKALHIWSSYFSHSTAALCALVAFLAAAKLERERAPRWAALLGIAAGYALLTRPYTAIALAAAGAVALSRGGIRPRLLVAWSAPLAVAAVAA